jgi:hypothetical protein
MMDFDRFETRVMLALYSVQFFRLQAVAFFAVAPSSRRDPAQHASKE